VALGCSADHSLVEHESAPAAAAAAAAAAAVLHARTTRAVSWQS
jgi:hypothetical protein